MVATRGQTGSDDPATSTPSSVVPGRHPVVSTPNPDAGANGGSETTQQEAVTKQPKLIPLKDREFRGSQLMKKHKLNRKTYIPREIE